MTRATLVWTLVLTAARGRRTELTLHWGTVPFLSVDLSLRCLEVGYAFEKGSEAKPSFFTARRAVH